MSSVYDFEALNIQGQSIGLGDFKGKALLIVNTASAAASHRSSPGWKLCTRSTAARGWWCWVPVQPIRRTGQGQQ